MGSNACGRQVSGGGTVCKEPDSVTVPVHRWTNADSGL